MVDQSAQEMTFFCQSFLCFFALGYILHRTNDPKRFSILIAHDKTFISYICDGLILSHKPIFILPERVVCFVNHPVMLTHHTIEIVGMDMIHPGFSIGIVGNTISE